jgi:hypothetical protein
MPNRFYLVYGLSMLLSLFFSFYFQSNTYLYDLKPLFVFQGRRWSNPKLLNLYMLTSSIATTLSLKHCDFGHLSGQVSSILLKISLLVWAFKIAVKDSVMSGVILGSSYNLTQ